MASSSTIMLSIHPIYSNKIFMQEKKIEFRKRIIPDNVTRILVYSTAPVREIIGYFDVNKIIHERTDDLWTEFSESGGIEKEKFYSYFSNTEMGYGILIGRTYRFPNPVGIERLRIKAPQFYKYIQDRDFDTICMLGNKRSVL